MRAVDVSFLFEYHLWPDLSQAGIANKENELINVKDSCLLTKPYISSYSQACANFTISIYTEIVF